ncbi:MAG TPA: E3 binding domain-containing protein, partial [Trebonia sp.]|nr:E3 binding domain-containing protein [Trebonia sp.]
MAAVVRMPAVLAGATEAALAHWLVSPGETVSVGTPIAEIETEKAMVEYEAEESGIVGRLLLGEGDTGEIGDPIAVLVAPGEGDAEIDAALGGSAAAAAAAAPGRVAEAAEDTAAEAGQAVADAAASSARNAAAPAASAGSGGAVRGTNGHSGAAHGGRVFASPLVRKLASERGVDLAELSGTGPNGRIVRRDLERFLAAGPALSARPLSGQSVPGQSVPGQPGSGQPGSGQPGTGPAERAGGGGAGGTALLGAPGGAT